MTHAHDHSLVRQRREELGLLLVDLARIIGRSAAFVSMTEHGFVPAAGRRKQVADALQTTPEALWPEEYR